MLKVDVCIPCARIDCGHSATDRYMSWIGFVDHFVEQHGHEVFGALTREIMKLMDGGPLGDGIGPRNAAFRLSRILGFSLRPEEVWAIWRQEKSFQEHRQSR